MWWNFRTSILCEIVVVLEGIPGKNKKIFGQTAGGIPGGIPGGILEDSLREFSEALLEESVEEFWEEYLEVSLRKFLKI